MSDAVISRITAMVAPILTDLGLDLYDIDFNGGILRIVVDTPPGGPSGVSIDTIALVTRQLGRELDHDENAVPGKFTLEVSSPGLERTLRTPAHFQREIGKTVSIRLRHEVDGRRRVGGVLVGANESAAEVRLDDNLQTVSVAYSSIDKAKTVFVWESQPKPNSKEARDARKAAKSTKSQSIEQSQEEISAP
jgi:ribosome maturation factor RimP